MEQRVWGDENLVWSLASWGEVICWLFSLGGEIHLLGPHLFCRIAILIGSPPLIAAKCEFSQWNFEIGTGVEVS